MEHGEFHKDRPTYHELGDGFALRSAPEREFGISYAVYRNVNLDFEDFLEYGSDLEGLNYCFWVLKHDETIGGIIIRPNHIEGLFLRPPHTNAYEVLKAAMPILLNWSDKTKPIEAVDVMPHELELYQRLGFRLNAGRRVYIRPTEPFDVVWDAALDVTTPTRADIQKVATLFHAAYSGYPGGLGSYSVEDWVRRTEGRLGAEDTPEICDCASTLVYDRARDLLVAACIVRLGRCITRPEIGIPKVADIGVLPEYRRRGLGGNMLRRALTALHGQYATLRFGVAAGNPAEAFYYDLGFMPGITQHTLVMPRAEC